LFPWWNLSVDGDTDHYLYIEPLQDRLYKTALCRHVFYSTKVSIIINSSIVAHPKGKTATNVSQNYSYTGSTIALL